jgi:hypothetical protein
MPPETFSTQRQISSLPSYLLDMWSHNDIHLQIHYYHTLMMAMSLHPSIRTCVSLWMIMIYTHMKRDDLRHSLEYIRMIVFLGVFFVLTRKSIGVPCWCTTIIICETYLVLVSAMLTYIMIARGKFKAVSGSRGVNTVTILFDKSWLT